jgi:hypothetical protein
MCARYVNNLFHCPRPPPHPPPPIPSPASSHTHSIAQGSPPSTPSGSLMWSLGPSRNSRRWSTGITRDPDPTQPTIPSPPPPRDLSTFEQHPGPPREVITEVVDGSLPNLNRCSPATHFPRTDVPQLPTPPASHSNVPSPAKSTSPVTPPNYEGDSAEIISSTGLNTMHISGDNISPPYHHHVHTRKSSSPIPAHSKPHASIDTKHTSPKKTSSGHQHGAPVKLNTVYAFVHHCRLVWLICSMLYVAVYRTYLVK